MQGKIWLIGALVCAAGLKAWLLWMDAIPFNADEAIVALMARHILQGERPVFFYGQAYMGSLDAWLVAAGFATLGLHVWVIRLIQTIMYLGTVITTAVLGEIVFDSRPIGTLAAWLMAIPVINVTLYTTASLGGYGEALLLGNVILILTLRIVKERQRGEAVAAWNWLAWGFLAGLGVWAFGLTLVYSVPAGVTLAWQLRKEVKPKVLEPLLTVLAGGVLGSLPWWGYAINHGVADTIGELGGSAIAGVEGLPYLLQVWQHITSLLLLGGTVTFGLRPPWSIRWLGLPLLPFALAFWLIALVQLIRGAIADRQNHGSRLLAGVALTLGTAFVFTPFGADPSGRYFLPLTVPLTLSAAAWVVSLKVRFTNQFIGRRNWGLVAILIVYNLWGTFQCAATYPPGITTQFDQTTQVDQRYLPELMAFLREHGEKSGYTNYWVAYPLAFLSSEELIYVPRLPYHTDFRYTSRDDRYAAYGELASEAERVAYITTRHPGLDQYLQDRFSEQNLTWQEAKIGEFHVFYNLSRVIRPEEIGLGVTKP
jgi:4-amino-4-deoxy-L-arabinose transferase-like glycosyltransferase